MACLYLSQLGVFVNAEKIFSLDALGIGFYAGLVISSNVANNFDLPLFYSFDFDGHQQQDPHSTSFHSRFFSRCYFPLQNGDWAV